MTSSVKVLKVFQATECWVLGVRVIDFLSTGMSLKNGAGDLKTIERNQIRLQNASAGDEVAIQIDLSAPTRAPSCGDVLFFVQKASQQF